MYHLVSGVRLLNVGFFLDTIEVLLQPVKKEQQKLLGVLLPVP